MCTKAKGFQKHFLICMFYNYLLLIGRINSLCNDIYLTVTNTPLPTPVGELRDNLCPAINNSFPAKKWSISLRPFNMSDVPVADVEETVEKADNDDEPAQENDW